MQTLVLTAALGDEASDAQIARLARTPGATVVAVAIDTGDGPSLGEIKARALPAGATRCHAVDVRDDFVRAVLLPSARNDAARRASTYHAAAGPATLALRTAAGEPVALNDVPMTPGELVESIETIAGMSAMEVLGVVYKELDGADHGVVDLSAEHGACTIAPAAAAHA